MESNPDSMGGMAAGEGPAAPWWGWRGGRPEASVGGGRMVPPGTAIAGLSSFSESQYRLPGWGSPAFLFRVLALSLLGYSRSWARTRFISACSSSVVRCLNFSGSRLRREASEMASSSMYSIISVSRVGM